jgi:hypothetical protein
MLAVFLLHVYHGIMICTGDQKFVLRLKDRKILGI